MTNLSPNAQKALDAFIEGYICNSYGQAYRSGLAAAIRELAEQVVPEQGCPIYGLTERENERQQVRSQLLAIVTELEQLND